MAVGQKCDSEMNVPRDVVQDDAREHPAGERQRLMSADAMNLAGMRSARFIFEERAAPALAKVAIVPPSARVC